MNPKGIPAELLNELFGTLPMENAIGLLAKIPNGLLARNLQKMFHGIKETMKNNKLNENDCGPRLTISKNGLMAKYSVLNGRNCVRSILPIPTFNMKINKPTIAFYFEIQILQTISNYGIIIGFCTQQLKLEYKLCGWDINSNSIGILNKRRMRIDGFSIDFENRGECFKKRDFIGLGIIHQPNSKMECFATCNGIFLGKTELPEKFAKLQLFPAVHLYDPGDTILAYFRKEKWQFKEFKCILA